MSSLIEQSRWKMRRRKAEVIDRFAAAGFTP